ncbi:MAG: LysR family transcriptional regulator [Blastomonas sp.]
MNWSHLQSFAAIARTGSLKAAGTQLGSNPTTVGRQLRQLEQQLGETLFEKTRDGQSLTARGQALLAQVERMEQAAAAYMAGRSQGEKPSGTIRVSASEGFGTAFVAPRLSAFAREYPDVGIDLVASSGFLNPSRKEADIAILLTRPRKGPLKVRQLTRYGLGIYAAPAWVARNGLPQSLAELSQHPMTGYIPDFIYAPELRYLQELDLSAEPALRSSSINAQAAMIASAGAIGVLPCFLAGRDSHFVRLLPDIGIERAFWLAVHRDIAALPHIRAYIDWLVAICQSEQGLLLNGI